jgi:hypothetical protein
MRRSIIAVASLASLASLGAMGCEDGPTQTYNPVAPGATPSGGNGTTVSPGSQGFVTNVGGQTKNDICTADQKAARWKKMVNEPLMPPSKAAGLDISGGPSWDGLTIDEAENPATGDAKPDGGNCQSENLGDPFGDGDLVNAWGDGQEVWFKYRVSTRKATQMVVWQGYIGEITAKSEDGADTWEIPLAPTPVKKNGTAATLDWVSPSHRNFDQPFNQIYRAMTHTFAPQIPLEPTGTTCFDSGRCIQGSFGDVAYFYIPSLGWAMWIDNQNAAQPTPSIITRQDQELAKVMSYSFANPLLKLDAEGPTGKAGILQTGKSDCTLAIGLGFGDFLSNCVQTTGDATKDKAELNKLLGGLSHGRERFFFDLQGIDINFTDSTLPADDIIHDNDVPTSTDTATLFDVDQATLGSIANDYTNNDPSLARDLHGAGAVYREYARLVRKDLLALRGVADGDPSACVFPVGWATDPSFDPSAFWASAPAWCTGFEGFITASAPTSAADRTNLGMNATHIPPGGLKGGLKLGHERVIFCDDANGDLVFDTSSGLPDRDHGYTSCSGGDTFPTSFRRVLQVFGHGSVATLPTEVQDVRFFWKEYVKATIKYLEVANDPTKIDLSGVQLDPDNLFFDSIGAGQFEIAEYVERGHADKTHEPTDFEISADVRNGIMNGYDISRDLYRGEIALYAATLTDQTHGLGQENSGLLSNLFGSPVLAGGWTASADGHTAYYCATNADPAHCDGQVCPLDASGAACLKDELGRPILYGYPGAFAGGATVFGLTLNIAPVTIENTYDSTQSAMIKVPLYTNPYDSTTTPLDPMTVLVPWAPKQPGIGFPIALNGSIDKFITSAQLDLSGTTITANIDYDIHIDQTTHKPDKDGRVDFKAVETTDYLGEVFLCQDPASGDILRARMYTPVATILDWLSAHPGTYAGCQMVIRYSPFGNYADYITSLANGVRLGITQGGGFGRVVDTTLFVPGQ